MEKIEGLNFEIYIVFEMKKELTFPSPIIVALHFGPTVALVQNA